MTLSFNGPVLIFGGPYSNLEALKAVQQVAHTRQIPADHCICTGDLVAYCADATAVIDEIRDWGCHVVMGNCEESLALSKEDCGCGFEEGSTCDLLSKQWFDYAQTRITQAQRTWMSSLPRHLSAVLNGVRMLFVHGTYEEINRFVFASQGDLIQSELLKTDHDMVIGGHAGVPFSQQCGDQIWLNAGVIGMPANEGVASSWYCLIDPTQKALDIHFHRLNYDYQTAQDKMIKAGLESGYAEALKTGLWPSLDVLPPAEKAQTGHPLSLKTVRYSIP